MMSMFLHLTKKKKSGKGQVERKKKVLIFNACVKISQNVTPLDDA